MDKKVFIARVARLLSVYGFAEKHNLNGKTSLDMIAALDDNRDTDIKYVERIKYGYTK